MEAMTISLKGINLYCGFFCDIVRLQKYPIWSEDWALKRLAGQVRVLKIDVDKNEALATQLRIQSVPTLIIFKKGEIVWRSSGVMGPEPIAEGALAID